MPNAYWLVQKYLSLLKCFQTSLIVSLTTFFHTLMLLLFWLRCLIFLFIFLIQLSLLFYIFPHITTCSHVSIDFHKAQPACMLLLSITFIHSPCMLSPAVHLIWLSFLLVNPSRSSKSIKFHFLPHLSWKFSFIFFELSIFFFDN